MSKKPDPPSLEDPCCPTCGRKRGLVEVDEADDWFFECLECGIRFTYEEVTDADDDTDPAAAMNTTCQPPTPSRPAKSRADTKVYSEAPVFGAVEELRDVPVSA
jgi:hypothetical protein